MHVQKVPRNTYTLSDVVLYLFYDRSVCICDKAFTPLTLYGDDEGIHVYRTTVVSTFMYITILSTQDRLSQQSAFFI